MDPTKTDKENLAECEQFFGSYAREYMGFVRGEHSGDVIVLNPDGTRYVSPEEAQRRKEWLKLKRKARKARRKV